MIERSEDHRYRRVKSPDHDGGTGYLTDWVPGVTSITDMMPKHGLVQWAANLVAAKASQMTIVEGIDRDELYHDLRAEPNRARDKAKSIGTRVHHVAEHDLSGQESLFDDDIRPWVEQYKRGYLERYSPTSIAREFYVWGGDYGGTADEYGSINTIVCPGAHPDTKGGTTPLSQACRWLIDYKTSTKPIRRSGFPYADTAVQLAALGYADIWQIDGEEVRTDDTSVSRDTIIDHYGVLAITPTQCELIEYDVTEAEWHLFQALKATKAWIDTRKGKVKR